MQRVDPLSSVKKTRQRVRSISAARMVCGSAGSALALSDGICRRG